MEGFIIVLVITLVAQYNLITVLSIEDYFKTKIEFIVTCIPIVGLMAWLIYKAAFGVLKAAFGVLKELNDFYKNLN